MLGNDLGLCLVGSSIGEKKRKPSRLRKAIAKYSGRYSNRLQTLTAREVQTDNLLQQSFSSQPGRALYIETVHDAGRPPRSPAVPRKFSGSNFTEDTINISETVNEKRIKPFHVETKPPELIDINSTFKIPGIKPKEVDADYGGEMRDACDWMTKQWQFLEQDSDLQKLAWSEHVEDCKVEQEKPKKYSKFFLQPDRDSLREKSNSTKNMSNNTLNNDNNNDNTSNSSSTSSTPTINDSAEEIVSMPFRKNKTKKKQKRKKSKSIKKISIDSVKHIKSIKKISIDSVKHIYRRSATKEMAHTKSNASKQPLFRSSQTASFYKKTQKKVELDFSIQSQKKIIGFARKPNVKGLVHKIRSLASQSHIVRVQQQRQKQDSNEKAKIEQARKLAQDRIIASKMSFEANKTIDIENEKRRQKYSLIDVEAERIKAEERLRVRNAKKLSICVQASLEKQQKKLSQEELAQLRLEAQKRINLLGRQREEEKRKATQNFHEQRKVKSLERENRREKKAQRRGEVYALNRIMELWNQRQYEKYSRSKSKITEIPTKSDNRQNDNKE